MLVDDVIRLLRRRLDGRWVLDASAEKRVAVLLQGAREGIDDLLKLIFVLETKHRSPETARALLSVIKSVPPVVERISRRCLPAPALTEAARALAAFEGRRAPKLQALPGTIFLYRFTAARADALETRRAQSRRSNNE